MSCKAFTINLLQLFTNTFSIWMRDFFLGILNLLVALKFDFLREFAGKWETFNLSLTVIYAFCYCFRPQNYHVITLRLGQANLWSLCVTVIIPLLHVVFSLLCGEEKGRNVQGSILGMEFQNPFSYIDGVASVADVTYHL